MDITVTIRINLTDDEDEMGVNVGAYMETLDERVKEFLERRLATSALDRLKVTGSSLR